MENSKFGNILSEVETGSINRKTDITAFLAEKSSLLGNQSVLLVNKVYELQFGLIDDGRIRLDRQDELKSELLQELRAFSDKGEIYLWKTGSGYSYRIRIDGGSEGNKMQYYESSYYMWGNKFKGDIIVEENRGMKFKPPFNNISQAMLPLRYTVRNYYSSPATGGKEVSGMIEFTDARLVSILDKAGNEVKNG